jgi:hypothetical protein
MRTALEFDDIDPAGAESYRPRGKDRRSREQTPQNAMLSTARTQFGCSALACVEPWRVRSDHAIGVGRTKRS